MDEQQRRQQMKSECREEVEQRWAYANVKNEWFIVTTWYNGMHKWQEPVFDFLHLFIQFQATVNSEKCMM